MYSEATGCVMHVVFILSLCPSLRTLSVEHLLKTIELPGVKISFFWCRSTDNNRLAGFGSIFTKAHSFGHSDFGRLTTREIIEVFFCVLLKTADLRGLGNLLLMKLVDQTDDFRLSFASLN